MRQCWRFTFCTVAFSFKEANEVAGALLWVDNDIIGVKADLFQKMWNWRIFMRHWLPRDLFRSKFERLMPRILFDNKALLFCSSTENLISELPVVRRLLLSFVRCQSRIHEQHGHVSQRVPFVSGYKVKPRRWSRSRVLSVLEWTRLFLFRFSISLTKSGSRNNEMRYYS